MLSFKKSGWLFLIILLVGCSTQNIYMTYDSPEYKKVTNNFVGEWAIISHKIGDKNPLERPFEKGMVALDFQTGVAKFTFRVGEAYIGEKLLDWKKGYPDLKIDEYKVITTANWKISKSGEILHFDNVKNTVDIRGTGNNFDGFFQSEKTKFAAAENVGKGGGIMGLVMNLATKSVTGTTELFPQIPSQSNFEFSSDLQVLTINSKLAMPASQMKLRKTK